jgi:2-oxo-4-hydroxy-4-carboxy--5-ureidoimidazoline (OHCU) decarboxylase
MKKASEYRLHAQECRDLAAKMDEPAQREQLIEMAEHWEKLAADRAALIRKHPDLAHKGEQEEEAGLPED